MVAAFVLAVVMGAFDVGIIFERTAEQSVYRCVALARNASVQFYSGCGKRHSRTAAYSSANKRIYAFLRQKRSQRAVSLPFGIRHGSRYYGAVFDLVNLKFFGMPEMLINLSVVVSYCDFHDIISFFRFIFVRRERCSPANSEA